MTNVPVKRGEAARQQPQVAVTDADREAVERWCRERGWLCPPEGAEQAIARARAEGAASERASVELCAALGLRVLSWLVDDNWGNSLDACDVCEWALASGLLERATYDPAQHGEIDEAEPGQEVWILTKAAIRARGQRSNAHGSR